MVNSAPYSIKVKTRPKPQTHPHKEVSLIRGHLVIKLRRMYNMIQDSSSKILSTNVLYTSAWLLLARSFRLAAYFFRRFIARQPRVASLDSNEKPDKSDKTFDRFCKHFFLHCFNRLFYLFSQAETDVNFVPFRQKDTRIRPLKG